MRIQDVIDGLNNGLKLRWVPPSIHGVKADPGCHLYLDRERVDDDTEYSVIAMIGDGALVERDDEDVPGLTFVEAAR